jgi:hypothetical protein
VIFFLIASASGVLLYPVADSEHRWVAVAVAVSYFVLALLVFLDARTRAHTPPRPIRTGRVDGRE